MKITILGSGSAYGTPMIFNHWRDAHPQCVQNQRTRASLLLQDEGKNVLIDAGPDLRLQINRENIDNLDAVLITHCHYDHIAGIPELPRAAKLLGHGIEVCASAATMNGLRETYAYLFNLDDENAEPESINVKWKIIPDDGDFSVCGLEFKTAKLRHHHLYSSFFRYKNVAYVTDWQEMTARAEELLRGLDLLILECNNGESIEDNGHADLFTVKNVLARLLPKRTVLTHLSARVDYNMFSQKLPDGVELAYDGMIINI